MSILAHILIRVGAFVAFCGCIGGAMLAVVTVENLGVAAGLVLGAAAAGAVLIAGEVEANRLARTGQEKRP